MTTPDLPATDRFGGPIHQRPELAGDGRLLFPTNDVRFVGGFIRGSLMDRTVDPFEGTADRLLLAESFARLDLGDTIGAAAWFREHGLLDLYAWTDGRSAVPDRDWPLLRRSDDTADRVADVAAEQDNVRWHLATLARLSERRARMDWDPAFGRLVLVARDDQLVVGSPAAGGLLGPREPVTDEPGAGALVTAQQEVLRRATEGWPRVTLFERAALRSSRTVAEIHVTPELQDRVRAFGTSWDATVDLELFLMAPYVERALEHQVDIKREPLQVDGQQRMGVVAREVREWRSILAPIYVQLFAGLQRVTRGEVGASVCRECGQPFVVIDARRRLFCNGRERSRYTQRERRRRIADRSDPTDPTDEPAS